MESCWEPDRLTIKQSATTTVVNYNVEAFGPASIVTFRLDGSESVNQTLKGDDLKSMASGLSTRCQGEKLVITISGPPGRDGRPSETVQSYELNAGRLIVKTVRAGKTVREAYTK